MPISLILTPFDHFHFRPALAVNCIYDLRICHKKNDHHDHDGSDDDDAAADDDDDEEEEDESESSTQAS